MQPIHPDQLLTFDFENIGYPEPPGAAALVERDLRLLDSRNLADARGDDLEMPAGPAGKDGLERR
jgi:hypothetical protein